MLDILSRDGKTYPETVEAAREAADGLKQALEPKILGKELTAMPCGCGAIHSGKAKAVEVLPAGRQFQYRNQISSWALWTVKMEEVDGSGHGYSIGLSSFLSQEEIEALFTKYFEDVDIDYLDKEKNGQELRAKGKRIDISETNEAHIAGGREILGFHLKSNSQFTEVTNLARNVEENELYLALLGAIHNAQGGDVISVPEDEMRAFAHEYMNFARVGTYLLIECGDTVSLRGVIQNVRRQMENVASHEAPRQEVQTTLLGDEKTGRHFWIEIDGENVFFDSDKTASNAFGLRWGSFESNRQYHEKMQALMGEELTFVVEGNSTQGFNVVGIVGVDA